MKKWFFLFFLILSPLGANSSEEWRDWPLEKKVSQLFVVPICPTHKEKHLEKVYNLLKEKGIGGVVFMSGTSDQQREIAGHLDNSILTYQDAEWGVGMRLSDFAPLPKNLTLGAIQNLDLLRDFGRELARQCRLVGISCNFSPVVDVNSNPLNPVIGSRSFGDDPQGVALRALAVMEGMKEGGILTCAKHFPGHGDTTIDSHKDLPCVDKNLSEMQGLELAPFQAVIDSGIDLIMVGHLYFPKLSPFPSSISPEIVTGLLRDKMGFSGPIISDSLAMAALSTRYSPEEIVEKALFAGVDILLTAANRPEIVDFIITEAVPRAIDHIMKVIPETLIDQKLERIMSLKKQKQSEIPSPQPDLCKTLFQHAITLVGEKVECGGSIALVQNSPDYDFYNALEKEKKVICFSYDQIEEAASFDTVIIQVGPKDHPKWIPAHATIALFDTPYRLKEFEDHSTILIGYENVVPAKEALAEVLLGKIPALGKLPVRVYTR